MIVPTPIDPAGGRRILTVVNLRLPQTVRSIGRVQVIAGVLTHHGFGHLVDRLQLNRYVPLPKRRPPPPADEGAPAGPDVSLGGRVVRVCQDLGPTFIKFGQMLSTRPDLVPAEIVRALESLQDRVPPFDSATARQIIEEDLGVPLSECYDSFEETPFASGSVAQVHRAVTRSTDGRPGQAVVVKVKRPHIEDTVRLDMNILRWIADLAERFVPDAMFLQPRMVVDEFERTMLREMDFINEAATITRFRELLEGDECVHVPSVHWELTGPQVLTLEMIPGASLQSLLRTPDPRINAKELADKLVRGFMRQFFQMGLFHADPHPGNLLIEPPATIGLIDFGLTGQIDDEMLGQLVIALTGALSREPEVIVEVLADMNALSDDTDRFRLRRDFGQLIEKYYGFPLHRFDLQELFYEVSTLVRENRVKLPREFVLFGKALVAVGGICLQLDPDLNLIETVKPRLKGLLIRRLEPARLIRSATISGWHLMNILKSAPGQLRDVSRRLARGQWQVNIRHQNIDYLAHEIDHASNRLVFAIIIGAIIVGSSWIISSDTHAAILNIPLAWFGVIGYLVAAVMGLWLVVAILRSGKLS